jgi:hypothetical protein
MYGFSHNNEKERYVIWHPWWKVGCCERGLRMNGRGRNE